jgi:hypothetical protein
MSAGFGQWFESAPLWMVGLVSIVLTALAWLAGYTSRILGQRAPPNFAEAGREQSQEGYVIAAALGLLALLMGFTFSLATDRFDKRRMLVLDEANTIGTTYLRAQLLEEPHRTRLSRLLVAYTDNRIALANATPVERSTRLATNDRLVRALWDATQAAYPSMRDRPITVSFLETMNHLIDLDLSRKAARLARVPPEVFLVLYIYFLATTGLLSRILESSRPRAAGALLVALFTVSLLLLVDIDRPAAGSVKESQRPMELARESLGR